jgi:hypothetical protein
MEAKAPMQRKQSVGAGFGFDVETPMEQLSVFLGQVLALKSMRLQQCSGYREVACAAKFRCEGGAGKKPGEKVR